jgi:hypothetical protein
VFVYNVRTHHIQTVAAVSVDNCGSTNFSNLGVDVYIGHISLKASVAKKAFYIQFSSTVADLSPSKFFEMTFWPKSLKNI